MLTRKNMLLLALALGLLLVSFFVLWPKAEKEPIHLTLWHAYGLLPSSPMNPEPQDESYFSLKWLWRLLEQTSAMQA